MTWAEYVDFGGEVQAESDQSGHEHSYRSAPSPDYPGVSWCSTCECWVVGNCDHERRPMCRRRADLVKKEWEQENK